MWVRGGGLLCLACEITHADGSPAKELMERAPDTWKPHSSTSNKNTISEVSEVRQLDRHGYYVTLGLLPGASAEAIRSAYVAIRTGS